ncbi:MAG: DEAD/DEAH box helicase [Pirellulales bacterium]
MPEPCADIFVTSLAGDAIAFSIAPFATGFDATLARPPKVGWTEFDWQPSPPPVASFSLGHPAPKVRSFQFAPPVEMSHLAEPDRGADRPPKRLPTVAAQSGEEGTAIKNTRLKPPGDIVKLEDRLFYLLQPSLESIFNGSLRLPFDPFPYQFEGIAFLYPRHHAVLADEMGLGKTMQAITAIRLLLHAGELRRVLLVCPKPLVTNWQREFHLWAPEIPLTVIAGDQTRRHWLWRSPEAVVTVANYELVVRDREVFEDAQTQFDLTVLDESQRIKNRAGATNEVVRGIRRGRSWALTGTPIENSTDDLVGIFEFVSPGNLTPGMKPRRVREIVSDYVLRRTKDQVLEDMPPRLIRDTALELTPNQRETYQTAEEEGIVRLTDMGGGLTVTHVFELILRLKQICNFDPASGESVKCEQLEADLEEVAASGKKAIVFSQWVKSLDQLQSRLARFGTMAYHGKIPSRQREQVIDRFRADPDKHVILMSYGAGSVGLNLQFCEYVFLFDRWWNPAVEDQAINRAHRIGAAGPVTVSRFVAMQTIEERIAAVLEEKRELFDTIFNNGDDGPRSLGLTQDEIFGLFHLHTPSGPVRKAA